MIKVLASDLVFHVSRPTCLGHDTLTYCEPQIRKRILTAICGSVDLDPSIMA